MIKLLVKGAAPAVMSKTSFGGYPVKNVGEGFEWPECACCELPMQFLGKLAVGTELHQIFMCQNDPGMCDEWDANGGGNSVSVIHPVSLEHVSAPAKGVSLREAEYSADVVEVEAVDYDEACSVWTEKHGRSPRDVLGQVSGQPAWIQGDEVPFCDQCSNPMTFIAQLEQGPDWETEMNFGGGGVAYSFFCSCKGTAKFLWQC